MQLTYQLELQSRSYGTSLKALFNETGFSPEMLKFVDVTWIFEKGKPPGKNYIPINIYPMYLKHLRVTSETNIWICKSVLIFISFVVIGKILLHNRLCLIEKWKEVLSKRSCDGTIVMESIQHLKTPTLGGQT